MNRADLTLIRSMTPAERKMDEIRSITTDEELAGYHMGRALEGRDPVSGENAALAAREKELRKTEKRGRG